MTMHKPLQKRGVIGRLYLSSKEEERRLCNIENCMDCSMLGLKDEKKSKEILVNRNK